MSSVLVRLAITLAVLVAALIAVSLGLRAAGIVALLALGAILVFAYAAPWPFSRKPGWTVAYPLLLLGVAAIAFALRELRI